MSDTMRVGPFKLQWRRGLSRIIFVLFPFAHLFLMSVGCVNTRTQVVRTGPAENQGPRKMLTPQQQIKKIRAELSDYAGEARAPSWKRECRDWCKKADLWTIIDAGEFVDSVGYRHALGVAFAIVEDFDSVDLAAEQSELEPAGNLTAVLKGGLSKGVSSLGVVCVYQKDAENLGTGDRCFISVSALD